MIYSYYCPKCNKPFSISCQPFKPLEMARCPRCQTPSPRQYIPIPHTWGPNSWNFDKNGLGDKLVRTHQ